MIRDLSFMRIARSLCQRFMRIARELCQRFTRIAATAHLFFRPVRRVAGPGAYPSR